MYTRPGMVNLIRGACLRGHIDPPRYQGRCIACRRERYHERMASDPAYREHRRELSRKSNATEGHRTRNRERYRADPAVRTAQRHRALKCKFGLSANTYDELLVAQGGGCALCRTPRTGRKSLAVDHEHATDRVRGLLCWSCNTTLGRYGDTYESLAGSPFGTERVLSYLRGPTVEGVDALIAWYRAGGLA